MKNFHLIEAKFMGPSNSRGSKVKITSLRFGSSITESYDYQFGSTKDQAEQTLKNLGFKPVGVGYDEKKQVYIFCSEIFEDLKDAQKSFKGLSARGWHKDHNNYNKAEKWERTPAKRKTPARNAKR
jgi:transposase